MNRRGSNDRHPVDGGSVEFHRAGTELRAHLQPGFVLCSYRHLHRTLPHGQFLRRHQLPKDLAYACFLRAENLLASADPDQLQTVQAARRQLESEMGKKTPIAAQKDLRALLARATNLPAGSL